MLNRAKVVDENFIEKVTQNDLPQARSATTLEEAGLDKNNLLDLFTSQLISRHLDLEARHLKNKNLSYYTIGSSGHEGNAAIGRVLRLTDMAFLHYRSGALMVERLKKLPQTDPIYELMLSFIASSEDAISGGRHKVFGSFPGFVPPQTSTIASQAPKAVGAAFSINLAKELSIPNKLPHDSIILCSMGDASLNHSVTQGALNAAEWIRTGNIPLPLILVCEDNRIGISVSTPEHWVENNISLRKQWHYLSADGLNIADVYLRAKQAEHIARTLKKPVFLHMRCVRLMGHAGSDIEQHYRSETDIAQTELQDPLLHTARIVIENQLLSNQEIIDQYRDIAEQVRAAAERAIKRPKLQTAAEVMESILPPALNIPLPKQPDHTAREKIFGKEWANLSQKRNLCQNINYALTDLMLRYPNTVLFGEDVAKKGGVYRVTADLVQRFGKRRVFDSLLDETTILGHAIGLAHNGFIPIPEIQFLAYYHNAEDQLRGEAATLSFFSKGQFTNPMVLRIAGLAYQKGFGGHFHNDNSIAVLRDVPGIIIACPSNGRDAVLLLRKCLELAYLEQRIVVFLEPIALYMTRDLHAAEDHLWLHEYPAPNEMLQLNDIGIWGDSKTLAIVTYGNGYYLSRQAEKILRDKHNIQIKIIDLRWLAPLPEQALINAVNDCQHILIVDECRKTGSLSEALMSLFVEQLSPLPKLKRITAKDCFIPLGQAWEYVLPSCDEIVQTVVEMVLH